MAWFTLLTNHLLSGVILQVGMYVLLLTLQEVTYPTKGEKKHPLLYSKVPWEILGVYVLYIPPGKDRWPATPAISLGLS